MKSHGMLFSAPMVLALLAGQNWATCVRECPLEAAAEACGSAGFWVDRLPRDAAKEAR